VVELFVGDVSVSDMSIVIPVSWSIPVEVIGNYPSLTGYVEANGLDPVSFVEGVYPVQEVDGQSYFKVLTLAPSVDLILMVDGFDWSLGMTTFTGVCGLASSYFCDGFYVGGRLVTVDVSVSPAVVTLSTVDLPSSDCSDVESLLVLCQSEKVALESQVSSVQSDLTLCQSEKVALEGVNANLVSVNSGLQGQVDVLTVENASLASQVVSLENQLVDAQTGGDCAGQCMESLDGSNGALFPDNTPVTISNFSGSWIVQGSFSTVADKDVMTIVCKVISSDGYRTMLCGQEFLTAFEEVPAV